jgi:mannose-6-phosphate isomerase-like protein (cupin superfamily)
MAKEAFVVELQSEGGFQRLLDDKSQSCGMKSGRVYLAPGESCGRHSTKEREELLVFLAGSGKAIIEGSDAFDVGIGKVAYVPPQTHHDIQNTGNEPLIYVYCVAPAGLSRPGVSEPGR